MGILFALAAGACWASYIVFGAKLGARIPGGMAASLGMIGAALVVLPFGLWNIKHLAINLNLLPQAFVLAMLSSAVPYALEMNAMRHVPTKTFGILMALEPVVACILGWLLLKETLSAQQWGAVVFITLAAQGSLWASGLRRRASRRS
jgi:inner membrane transporter RhtA